MSKPLKVYTEWLESAGYSSQQWLSGDWCQPLHLLSKMLAHEIEARRNDSDAHYRISFAKMCQLAEDCLGIPQLVVEGDLAPGTPRCQVALMTLLIVLKSSTDYITPQAIRQAQAPTLSFEMKGSSSTPVCSGCKQYAMIVERVILDGNVWHLNCLKCAQCGERLRKGALKKARTGYECIEHSARRILDASDSLRSSQRSIRPAFAPPPTPKPIPPPKPKIHSIQDHIDNEDIESTKSADSGVAGVSDTREPTPCADSDEMPAPVPPPRIKRASILVAAGVTPPRSPAHSRSSSISSIPPVPKPRTILPAKARDPSPASVKSREDKPIEDYPKYLSPFDAADEEDEQTLFRPSSAASFVEYPSYLCPFEDCEAEDSKDSSAGQYDESKNPFADSDDDEDSKADESNNSGSTETVAVTAFDPTTPPPKPARNFDLVDGFKTLRISAKQIRAPRRPVAKRTIAFTEHGVLEGTTEIKKSIVEMEEKVEELVTLGRSLEPLLTQLNAQNWAQWSKTPECGRWVELIERLMELIREENQLTYRWRESYLNEVHSETEYQIRCLLEKEEKSPWELSREATLTNLLIAIIDEKSKLSECVEADLDVRPPGLKRDEKIEKKKSKLKKRVAILKKHLKKT